MLINSQIHIPIIFVCHWLRFTNFLWPSINRERIQIRIRLLSFWLFVSVNAIYYNWISIFIIFFFRSCSFSPVQTSKHRRPNRNANGIVSSLAISLVMSSKSVHQKVWQPIPDLPLLIFDFIKNFIFTFGTASLCGQNVNVNWNVLVIWLMNLLQKNWKAMQSKRFFLKIDKKIGHKVNKFSVSFDFVLFFFLFFRMFGRIKVTERIPLAVKLRVGREKSKQKHS